MGQALNNLIESDKNNETYDETNSKKAESEKASLKNSLNKNEWNLLTKNI